MITTTSTSNISYPFSFSFSFSYHGIKPKAAMDQKPRTFECGTLSERDASQRHQRKSAKYKPNIWHFDFIQSLGKSYPHPWNAALSHIHTDRVEWLKQDVLRMLSRPMESMTKLELINCVVKLGLSDLFEQQIKEALDELVAASHSHTNNNSHIKTRDTSICHAALRFRLLRQYGHDISLEFDDPLEHHASHSLSAEALGELLEASNLAREGEDMLDAARAFSVGILKERAKNLGSDLSRRVIHSLELPLHRRVRWFDVSWQIDAYERSTNRNPSLLELAKLNFNALQAVHQDDLKGVSRWWRDLKLMQHLDFTRDRLVESFITALGMAPGLEGKSLRRSLTKVVALILVIDDVYDIFGSFEELKCFTRAIKTWDSDEIGQLPKCMKVSFQALDDVTTQIAGEIGMEKDLDRVVPRLRKAWADWCEGMFVEAKWDNTRHVPTLEEYLDNSWITSSCPLILSIAYHFLSGDRVDDVPILLEMNKDLIYNSSVILRLCNDLRTSAAEGEGGGTPSAVACYMQEANVSDEIAREHIEGLITRSWKGMNTELYGDRPEHSRPFLEITVNAARTAHVIYQHGDGFGVQGDEMRELISASLVQPFSVT